MIPGLRRHVERRRGLVGDQHLGACRDRDRDHHPLAHAPRKLMRIAVEPPRRIREPDLAEQVDRACAGDPLGTRLSCVRIASTIWRPIERTGFRDDIGSCPTSAIRPPRTRAISRSESWASSTPRISTSPARRCGPGAEGAASARARSRTCPKPRFSEQAEPLACSDGERRAADRPHRSAGIGKFDREVRTSSTGSPGDRWGMASVIGAKGRGLVAGCRRACSAQGLRPR